MVTKSELYGRTATQLAKTKVAEKPIVVAAAEQVDQPEPLKVDVVEVPEPEPAKEEVAGYKVQVYQEGRIVAGEKTKGWDDQSPVFATKEEAEQWKKLNPVEESTRIVEAKQPTTSEIWGGTGSGGKSAEQRRLAQQAVEALGKGEKLSTAEKEAFKSVAISYDGITGTGETYLQRLEVAEKGLSKLEQGKKLSDLEITSIESVYGSGTIQRYKQEQQKAEEVTQRAAETIPKLKFETAEEARKAGYEVVEQPVTKIQETPLSTKDDYASSLFTTPGGLISAAPKKTIPEKIYGKAEKLESSWLYGGKGMGAGAAAFGLSALSVPVSIITHPIKSLKSTIYSLFHPIETVKYFGAGLQEAPATFGGQIAGMWLTGKIFKSGTDITTRYFIKPKVSVPKPKTSGIPARYLEEVGPAEPMEIETISFKDYIKGKREGAAISKYTPTKTTKPATKTPFAWLKETGPSSKKLSPEALAMEKRASLLDRPVEIIEKVKAKIKKKKLPETKPATRELKVGESGEFEAKLAEQHPFRAIGEASAGRQKLLLVEEETYLRQMQKPTLVLPSIRTLKAAAIARTAAKYTPLLGLTSYAGKISTSNILGVAPTTTAALKPSFTISLKKAAVTKLTPISAQTPSILQTPVSAQAPSTITSTQLIPLLAQTPVARQRVAQATRVTARQVLTPKLALMTILVRPEQGPLFGGPAEQPDTNAYDVYVREGERRGDKFKRVARGLPRYRAEALGKDITDRYIEASFRLKRLRQKAKEKDLLFRPDLSKYRSPKRKSKLPPNTFIEKRQFRLDTPTETQQISYFKQLKERKQALQGMFGIAKQQRRKQLETSLLALRKAKKKKTKQKKQQTSFLSPKPPKVTPIFKTSRRAKRMKFL